MVHQARLCQDQILFAGPPALVMRKGFRPTTQFRPYVALIDLFDLFEGRQARIDRAACRVIRWTSLVCWILGRGQERRIRQGSRGEDKRKGVIEMCMRDQVRAMWHRMIELAFK